MESFFAESIDTDSILLHAVRREICLLRLLNKREWRERRFLKGVILSLLDQLETNRFIRAHVIERPDDFTIVA